MVDLPAPFGPRKPTISPAAHAEADVVHGRDGAEIFAEVCDLDHVRVPFAGWTDSYAITGNGSGKFDRITELG